MVLILTLLTACGAPCAERAGVYSGTDEHGLKWNLRMTPGNTQYFETKTMEYTLGVQVPEWDNAHAFVVGDRFNREMCRAERVSMQGPMWGETSVESVYLKGDVEGEVDRSGSLFLRYTLDVTTPDGQQALEHEVTIPRVESIDDWVGDTGDTWF